MKQVLQSLKDGGTRVVDVPTPRLGSGQILIRTRATVVSAGTERMLLDFGRANWLEKARQQPDKVRQVLEKMHTDGIMATVDAVRGKLDQPLAVGYCNAGTVVELGRDVHGFAVGDRVASNGRHAEVVAVPKNLCAKIPDCVSDEAAAFTVLGAIALQGIRLANPTLGECVVVTGLGLVGLLTVQLLLAQGCRVLGIDIDAQRIELARQFGAEVVNPVAGEDVQSRSLSFSGGVGVDAVIITASTKSNDLVSEAAKMCRKRGRIVLVGVVGLQLNRTDFYEKELTFQVSCSYGPGRYDSDYEEKGQDYPVGFVRWTEQRNFDAVLKLMASGALNVAPLITHKFAIENAEEAFALLVTGERSLGILINYNSNSTSGEHEKNCIPLGATPSPGKAIVSFLGAGNYASRTLIPAFRASGAKLKAVVSSGGVNAIHCGKKHGFSEACTDAELSVLDPAIDTVVVATRHNLHASQILAALRAGKHVFCEKPLCLTLEELSEIVAVKSERPDLHLMVGFNRRFSPHVKMMSELLSSIREPKSFVLTVNAGEVPADHWTQDPSVGGGRLIGEACHFIDLLRHLASAPISRHRTLSLGGRRGLSFVGDVSHILLEFEDGSIGSIHYLANGHRSFPKERLEVFAAGRVLQLDNFRKLRGWGWKGFSKMALWRQDKGQLACAKSFVDSVINGLPSPIAIEEIYEVSRVSIEVANTV